MTQTRITTHKKPRKIVGFSLSEAMAEEVKAEAARRGIKLKMLFVEMWERYRANKPA